MTGDAEMQPVESGDALSDLADALAPAADESEQEEVTEEVEEATESDESEDEGDEDPEQDEEEAEEPTFTIKHDGKEVTLKQSELIELGQKGFDYSTKTMAVAEERKAVEAERGKVKEVVNQHEEALKITQQRLQAFVEFVGSQIGSPPDISLLQTNSTEYLVRRETYEAQKGQLQQALAEIQEVEAQRDRLRQSQRAQQADQTWNELRDTLPGWKEDMDTKFDALAKYANAAGLNAESAGDAILHKGFWELAYKAQAYDAIQAKKAEMKPKEKLAKVAKPSAQNQSARMTERAKREANFHKNPSVDALADLLR